jgi:ketosteroid isomerase-like protein
VLAIRLPSGEIPALIFHLEIDVSNWSAAPSAVVCIEDSDSSYDDGTMVRYAPLFLVMAAVALCAPEDEIRAADQRWAIAVKTGDTAALERMYTSDLIYAHATGNIENKSQYIERLKSGKQKYSDVIIEKTKVVAYGDSAVSHSIVRTIGTNDNGPFNDHVMMMHLWVKQRGEWRLAAHQTTKIP